MKFPSRPRLLLFVLVAVAISCWGWVAPADQLIVGYGLLVVAAFISVVLMARHSPRNQTGQEGWGGPGDDGPDERNPLGDGPDSVDLELWLMIDREQSAAGELA